MNPPLDAFKLIGDWLLSKPAEAFKLLGQDHFNSVPLVEAVGVMGLLRQEALLDQYRADGLAQNTEAIESARHRCAQMQPAPARDRVAAMNSYALLKTMAAQGMVWDSSEKQWKPFF